MLLSYPWQKFYLLKEAIIQEADEVPPRQSKISCFIIVLMLLGMNQYAEANVSNYLEPGFLFPTFSKMVRFAPYKQIGIVFTLNNNNNHNNI